MPKWQAEAVYKPTLLVLTETGYDDHGTEMAGKFPRKFMVLEIWDEKFAQQDDEAVEAAALQA